MEGNFYPPCFYEVALNYPVLAKQVKYFKKTEGGQEIMCEIVENLAEKWAEEMVEERALEEKKSICHPYDCERKTDS